MDFQKRREAYEAMCHCMDNKAGKTLEVAEQIQNKYQFTPEEARSFEIDDGHTWDCSTHAVFGGDASMAWFERHFGLRRSDFTGRGTDLFGTLGYLGAMGKIDTLKRLHARFNFTPGELQHCANKAAARRRGELSHWLYYTFGLKPEYGPINPESWSGAPDAVVDLRHIEKPSEARVVDL